MPSSHSLLFRGGRGIRFLAHPSLLHYKPYPHPTTISGFRSNSKPVAANFSISELRSFPGTTVTSSSPAGLLWVSRMSSGTAAADDSSFVLSDTCTLKILEGDVTQWFVDGSSDAIEQDLCSSKEAAAANGQSLLAELSTASSWFFLLFMQKKKYRHFDSQLQEQYRDTKLQIVLLRVHRKISELK